MNVFSTMENILSKLDYEFETGFPELSEKRDDPIVKEENKIELNIKNDPQDILADMDNFTSAKNFTAADATDFSDADFKYLLTKSPSDEPKKPIKSKKESEEEERERMQVLVSNFTEDQLDRYEMYRRAAFPKASIKRIMQMITGNTVSQNVVIAMSGIAKVFVGEVVEEALDIMEAQNDCPPLQPKHLREAARRLRLKGKIPGLSDKKPNYRF